MENIDDDHYKFMGYEIMIQITVIVKTLRNNSCLVRQQAGGGV